MAKEEHWRQGGFCKFLSASAIFADFRSRRLKMIGVTPELMRALCENTVNEDVPRSALGITFPLPCACISRDRYLSILMKADAPIIDDIDARMRA